MATVNEKLRDLAVDHSIELIHYSNGVVRRLIALLNRTDADLAAQLIVALSRVEPTEASVARLDALLASVKTLNAQAYATVTARLEQEVSGLVEHEVTHQRRLFEVSVPPQVLASVGLGEVSVQQLYVAALSRPFQGRLLSEWGQSLEQDRFVRIRDAVRIGYTEQQTITQIVQRLRGTKAAQYQDGLLQTDRRALEAVVRTAVGHTAGSAADAFYKANADLIDRVQWVSTLDTRTTLICAARDGLEYDAVTHAPIGHSLKWLGGPGKAHWGCRSTSVPITKSWAELGGENLPSFMPDVRSSMDGNAPAAENFSQWLKKQPNERQNEVLGAERAQLFRSGGLTIAQFENNKGRTLTLEELRARHQKAFARAGL